MLQINIILFFLYIFVLVKSADYAVKYSHKIAKSLNLPDFITSFFIVSFISVIPEAAISIISAVKQTPQFGLGTLLGSTIADLTFVFGLVSLFSYNGIKIKSIIINKNLIFLLILIFPFLLGLDGSYSHLDGIILVFIGIFFFLHLFIQANLFKRNTNKIKIKNITLYFLIFIISIIFLLYSADFTVNLGVEIAKEIKIPIEILSLTIVSLGVCLPETIFSIRSARENLESLSIGDIFGTVIINSTIILGIMSIIHPFSFDTIIIYISGTAMIISSIILIIFFKTEKTLTKKEGFYLVIFYIIYIIIQSISNKIF
ncbi:MAG: hypothetical protein QXJ06_04400 [Candidatus Aenigmatarchaeota archaeon]